MSDPTTSILLADFQFLTREGITNLINKLPEFEVKKHIDDPVHLADAVDEEAPDLVVLDVSNHDDYLVGELEKLKAKSNETSYLIISNSQDKASVQRLLSMGIKGIVTKNCSEEEITNAIKSVAKGNRFFCNNILELVVAGENEEYNCEPMNLSPREYEVLKLITKGLKTNQIADSLHLSVHTINSHRKNILKKLHLKSPAELIVYALESGLVKF